MPRKLDYFPLGPASGVDRIVGNGFFCSLAAPAIFVVVFALCLLGFETTIFVLPVTPLMSLGAILANRWIWTEHRRRLSLFGLWIASATLLGEIAILLYSIAGFRVGFGHR